MSKPQREREMAVSSSLGLFETHFRRVIFLFFLSHRNGIFLPRHHRFASKGREREVDDNDIRGHERDERERDREMIMIYMGTIELARGERDDDDIHRHEREGEREMTVICIDTRERERE